jgi:hypothetical protein
LSTVLADTKNSVNVAINDPNAPSFVDSFDNANGTPRIRRYATATFTVPPGADHLSGTYSYPGGPTGESIFHMALIGPNGEYEANSESQGLAHFGQSEVQHPAAGQWTAVFYASLNPNGYHGPLAYDFVSSKYADFGTVSPASASIAPGASKTFTVKATLPSDAGDETAAVEFDTALHGQSTVPLTLRSLLSTGNDGGAFHGTLTGGNGRGFTPSQAKAYYLDVPAGKKNLGIDFTLAGATPGHTLEAVLAAPDHEVVAKATNVVLDASGNPSVLSSLQAYVDTPTAGRWELVIYDLNPVVGGALSQNFTGHLKYNLVNVTAAGLPKGQVAKGTPITATVTVKNTGTAPESFFADPRLAGYKDYNLPAQPGFTATVPLPAGPPFPTFLVPTRTTRLDLSQSSTIPADFAGSPFDNFLGLGINTSPEVYGAPHGLTADVTVTSPAVAQGQWNVTPTVVGPTNAAVTGTATDTAVAHTQAFDTSAVASTGDFWQSGVDASAPPLNALVLQPGQSGTITVVITPSAASGTTVNGVIYVDDFSSALSSGDELVGIPYSYTVK